MSNLPLTGLEAIFLRSLLTLRLIFFCLNYHDCFKNQIVQIQAEYVLHLFHHDLVKEQYKKERDGILLKSL